MRNESSCTGDPDQQWATAPAHTHHVGPLCQGWPPDNYPYEDGRYQGCNHGSCLDLVHEDCPGCQYEAWMALA